MDGGLGAIVQTNRLLVLGLFFLAVVLWEERMKELLIFYFLFWFVYVQFMFLNLKRE
jgi:hypothetical protein